MSDLSGRLREEGSAMSKAVNGEHVEGSFHYLNWQDKPHRLVYDAVGLFNKAADEIERLKAEVAAAKESNREWRQVAVDNLQGMAKCREILAAKDKQIALLREAIDTHLNPCGCFQGCEFCNGKLLLEEALAATEGDKNV